MNVLILAAGRGERYREQSRNFPILTKCLIRLNGETILGRQIRLLKKHGLHDITVAVPPHFPTLDYNAKFIILDAPPRSEETWTLQQCRDTIRNTSTLVLNGDVVFTDETLTEILNEPWTDIMFICGDIQVTHWKRIGEERIAWKKEPRSIYGVLTHGDGGIKLKKILERIDTQRRIYGLFHLKNRIKRRKLYIPTGFITDVDKHVDLVEVKKWLKGV